MQNHQDRGGWNIRCARTLRCLMVCLHYFCRSCGISWKIVHGTFKYFLLPVVLLVSAVDFWFEWQGIPDSFQQKILAYINKKEDDLQYSWIQLGVIRGVVVHDFRVVIRTKAGLLEMTAGKMSLGLDRGELILGRFLPRRVSIENANLRLLGKDGVGNMNISEVFLAGDLEENNNLVLNGKGVSAGLGIEFHTLFTRARQGILRLLTAPPGEAVEVDEGLQDMMAGFYEHWKRLLPKGNDSRLRVEVQGVLDNPMAWRVTGYMNVSDAYLHKMSALQCACEFSGTMQRLVISNIHLVLLGHTDNLTAKVVLYPLEKEAEVSMEGLVTRQALSDLFEELSLTSTNVRQWQGMLAHAPWTNLRFQGKLARSPLTLQGLNATLRLVLPDTNCLDNLRCGGEVNVRLEHGVVSLRESVLTIGPEETVRVSGQWNMNSNSLTASVKGAFDLRRVLSEQEELSKVFAVSNSPCEFSLELDLPHLEPEKARFKGDIRQNGLKLLGIDCSEAVLPISAADGIVTIAKGYATRSSNHTPMIEMTADVSLAEMMKTGRLAVEIPSFCLYGDMFGAEVRALTTHGNVTWDRPSNTFAMAIEGDSYVETFYQEYFRRFCDDVSGMLGQIYCHEGHPMHYSVSIPEFSLNHPEELTVKGAVAFGAVTFHGLEMESASCASFTATTTSCDLQTLRGRTAAGDECEFNLHVAYSPMELTFSNCKLWGDPRVIGAFFVNKTVEDVYLSVFKDIRWSDKVRPVLQMPRLVFYNEETWRVNSDGIYLNAKEMAYRNLSVDEANIIVMLDLPSAVVVEPVTVIKGDWWVSGKVEADLVGVKQCRFQVFNTQVGVDVIDVLGGLWPDVKTALKDVEISKDCQMEFHGSLFLSGQPRLRLDGSLTSRSISYHGIAVKDADLDWSFDSGDIHWNLKRGRVFGGDVATSGDYSIRHRRGQTLLVASGLVMEDIQRQLSSNGHNAVYLGRMSGEINVSFLQNWAGRKLHLDGVGHLHLTDADLWQMPALSGLEKILKSATGGWLSAGVGRISEVDSDFQFNGQRIVASRIQTNGTIVALNGSGSYAWTDDEREGTLNFKINGTPVKDVKLLSMVLSPVSYLFQAELTGTPSRTSWKMKSLLDLLF